MTPCLTPFVMKKVSYRADASFLGGIPFHENRKKNQRHFSVNQFFLKQLVVHSVKCFSDEDGSEEEKERKTDADEEGQC